MSRSGIFRDRAMADHTDKETRSAIMSKVRSKDTKPEMEVRRALHRAGFRFRLHRSDLPGKPDLVFSRHSLALVRPRLLLAPSRVQKSNDARNQQGVLGRKVPPHFGKGSKGS